MQNLKINYWLLLGLFLLPLWLNGQAANISIETEYQTLENNFEAKELSPSQLISFQKKSKQSLKDFLNLVELIAQEKFDATFQEKLKQQALHIFSSPTDSLFFLKKSQSIEVQLVDFLNDSEQINQLFPSFELSNLGISNLAFSENIYSWDLSFQINSKHISPNHFNVKCILKQQKKTIWRSREGGLAGFPKRDQGHKIITN